MTTTSRGVVLGAGIALLVALPFAAQAGPAPVVTPYLSALGLSHPAAGPRRPRPGLIRALLSPALFLGRPPGEDPRTRRARTDNGGLNETASR